MAEIHDRLTEAVAKSSKYFSSAYDDGRTTDPKEFEDDNFIHIARGTHRFVFYNGQGKGRFTNSDVKTFAKIVDNALKNVCTCEHHEGGWFFDFSTDPAKSDWQHDPKLEAVVKQWLTAVLKQAKKKLGDKAVNSEFEVLLNLERAPKKDRDEFMTNLIKWSGRHVQGWEFRFGMNVMKSDCPVHGDKIQKEVAKL